MGKVIQIEVPEDVDLELFKKEVERALGRVILMKELEDVDVDETVIDEVAEDIKKSGWERIEKWLKS